MFTRTADPSKIFNKEQPARCTVYSKNQSCCGFTINRGLPQYVPVGETVYVVRTGRLWTPDGNVISTLIGYNPTNKCVYAMRNSGFTGRPFEVERLEQWKLTIFG